MPRASDLLFLGGRTILGAFFLQNAFNHFTNTKQMAQYAESKEVTTPYLAVLGSGTLLALAGSSFLLGRRPKVGVAAATLFFAGVSPKMHDFWNIEDEKERMDQLINFSKNLALMGATLALSAVPEPWPISVRTKKQREKLPEGRDLEQAIEAGHS